MESPAYRGHVFCELCPSVSVGSVATVPIDPHEWISFEDDSTTAHLGVRCHVPASRTGAASSATAARACSTHDATELAQGCCSYGAHFIDDDDVQTVLNARHPARRPATGSYKKGRSKGVLARRGRRDHDSARRRCLHLSQPAGLSRAAPAAPCTSPRSRPASGHGLEARRVLAAAAAARRRHRRLRLRHVDTARMEAARLGRRWRRVPLVVHRDRRRLRRRRAGVPATCATRSSRWSAPRSTTRWWRCSSAPSGRRSPTPPSSAADPIQIAGATWPMRQIGACAAWRARR